MGSTLLLSQRVFSGMCLSVDVEQEMVMVEQIYIHWYYLGLVCRVGGHETPEPVVCAISDLGA